MNLEQLLKILLIVMNDFNFKPNTSLEKGLQEFWNWYKEYYKVNQ